MNVALPRYRCSDKTLEEALNGLSEAVERALNRNVHLGAGMFGHVDTDNLLVEAVGGDGGTVESYPFQPYNSSYLGTGTPPEDQAFRFKIKKGSCNSRIFTNVNEEFTATAGSSTTPHSTYYWLKVAFDVSDASYPAFSTVTMETGDTVPDEEEVDEGAPPYTYQLLGEVRANDKGIIGFWPMVKHSVHVIPVTIGKTCGQVRMGYQWTGV